MRCFGSSDSPARARFFSTGSRYSRLARSRRLLSTNPEHEAITIGPTTVDAEIVGVVVGAIVGTRRATD